MTDDHQTIRVAPPKVEEALREKMQQLAIKEREREAQEQAAASGWGYVNLVGFPIGPETIALISRATAEKIRAISFVRTINQIRIAAIDPTDAETQAIATALGEKYHAHVEFYLISEHSLATALKMYDRLPKIITSSSDISITQGELEKFQQQIQSLDDLNQRLQNVSMTDTFSFLLAGAIRARSSDIHIEAEADGVRVRYRIDGVLTPVATLPTEKWPRIISRIKLIAGLKINITSKPQDGRATLVLQNEKIDIRISTLPTAFGESVVMRLLRPSSAAITFDELGLRGSAGQRLETEIGRPNGMIVITGPTGSGKSTTLYAVMKKINRPDTKIITLEDPIEYKLEGINQSQVDWAKGYTFAVGLRSILRQDPDTIMVGEIRDLETAETAIQAALTGHLVLSTVHTNDAAGAIPRFLSMGAKPYLLAPALNCAVGQRLVRRICEHCVVEEKLEPEAAKRAHELLASIPANSGYAVDLKKTPTFKKGAGCKSCNGLGYYGRIGIFEVLVVDDEVEKMILTGSVSEYQMRDVAKRQGMITMAQDGMLKAVDGMTSVTEVFRLA